jgi:hypothetical protein
MSKSGSMGARASWPLSEEFILPRRQFSSPWIISLVFTGCLILPFSQQQYGVVEQVAQGTLVLVTNVPPILRTKPHRNQTILEL